MRKFDVVIALEAVNEAHKKWTQARLEFLSGSNAVMSRLIREAAVNFMSAEEVAKASGFTTKRVRQIMRDAGLNPKSGKHLLSKTAAEALASNAVLLGIEPSEMDLMSPLAYLPMGEKMKRELQDKQISQVTELDETEIPETEVERLAEVFKAAWHSRDDYWRTSTTGTGLESQSDRTQTGIRAVLEALKQATQVTEVDETVLVRIDRETWEEHQANGECPVSSACCGCHLDYATAVEQ